MTLDQATELGYLVTLHKKVSTCSSLVGCCSSVRVTLWRSFASSRKPQPYGSDYYDDNEDVQTPLVHIVGEKKWMCPFIPDVGSEAFKFIRG